MSTTGDTVFAASLLSDPRIDRLLTMGREINDLLTKIKAATTFLSGGGSSEDFEAVELARRQLSRDLARDYAEVVELMPAVDEMISKLQEERKELQEVHMLNVGLARIEGLSGTDKHAQFVEAADASKTKISEIDNLIRALDALERDLSTTRRAPHICPRCSSPKVSYRISPSEFGFTIFRCDDCSNAWRITEYSLK